MRVHQVSESSPVPACRVGEDIRVRVVHQVSESSPIPGESRHKPELDGIRGLAILLVLLSHSVVVIDVLPQRLPHPTWTNAIYYLLIPGWSGVDLFFVLSGFLITGILLRTRQKPTYFSSFYARRAVRIFPIYYAVLFATIAVAHFVPAVWHLLPQAGKSRLSYFVYLQNIPFFWPSWLGMVGLWGAFWSLAVEEQFYLVWPSIARWLPVRGLLALSLGAAVLELPLRLLLAHRYFGLHLGLIQFTPARADGLFVGAAIAAWMHLRRRPVPKPAIAAGASLAAAVLLWIAVLHHNDLTGDGRLYTYGVSAFALGGGALVAWSQHHPPALQRLLELRWLRAAGRYSYGMYVYHLSIYLLVHRLLRREFPQTGGELSFFPALAVIAATILLSTLFAKLSFDLVERRFLALKRFFPS